MNSKSNSHKRAHSKEYPEFKIYPESLKPNTAGMGMNNRGGATSTVFNTYNPYDHDIIATSHKSR